MQIGLSDKRKRLSAIELNGPKPLLSGFFVRLPVHRHINDEPASQPASLRVQLATCLTWKQVANGLQSNCSNRKRQQSAGENKANATKYASYAAHRGNYLTSKHLFSSCCCCFNRLQAGPIGQLVGSVSRALITVRKCCSALASIVIFSSGRPFSRKNGRPDGSSDWCGRCTTCEL